MFTIKNQDPTEGSLIQEKKWHQEEQQTNHDRKYTSHKQKKHKAIRSLFSQGDDTARQDPLNATVRQRNGQTMKNPSNE